MCVNVHYRKTFANEAPTLGFGDRAKNFHSPAVIATQNLIVKTAIK